MSLKISKLDIHLPMDLVRACASLSDAQLCKFVATNNEGEFQHSIEVRHKHEKGISLELSNLEIGYDDGRFVAEIMQVFKVFQGPQEGADQVAVVMPTNAQSSETNQRPSAAVGRSSERSNRRKAVNTSHSDTERSDSNFLHSNVEDSGGEVISDTGAIEYRNTNKRLSNFHQRKDRTMSPRQGYESSPGSGASQGTMAPKRLKMLHTEDSNSSSLVEGEGVVTKTELIDTKDDIIEVKQEIEDGENGLSQRLGIPPGPFVSPRLPTDSADEQSHPFITDVYSQADPSTSQNDPAFPTGIPTWQSPGLGLDSSLDNSVQELSPGTAKSRNWTCSECSKTFNSKWSYTRHQDTHKERARIVCSYGDCSASYMSWDHLWRHISSTHVQQVEDKTGKVWFKCPEDFFMFSCDWCERTFSGNTQYRRHLREQHASLPRPFECEFCGKRFKRKYHLRSHVNSVHKKLSPKTNKDAKIEPTANLEEDGDEVLLDQIS